MKQTLLTVRQKFIVRVDGEEHILLYYCNRLTGKILFTIDGDAYPLRHGACGIGLRGNEVFRLGERQAMLSVSASGVAKVTVPGATEEH